MQPIFFVQSRDNCYEIMRAKFFYLGEVLSEKISWLSVCQKIKCLLARLGSRSYKCVLRAEFRLTFDGTHNYIYMYICSARILGVPRLCSAFYRMRRFLESAEHIYMYMYVYTCIVSFALVFIYCVCVCVCVCVCEFVGTCLVQFSILPLPCIYCIYNNIIRM